jgi:putative ABC transport system permease protein
MIVLWLRGLLRERGAWLVGGIAGLALTVAFLAALGTFVTSSAQTMARRAVAGVPVDWQVLLAPTAETALVLHALGEAAPSSVIQAVGYADTSGFAARTGETVQTTGPGKVLGIDSRYAQDFGNQLRLVLGDWNGVLIAAQTAANLHSTVGDWVSVQRMGMPAVDVRIAGVVALPNADAMFQAVGTPKGTAPQAPPDNVLLMPMALWHQLFDPQRGLRPDSVRLQLHVRLDPDTLPGDPADAFIKVQQQANNVEARLAGSAVISNNIAARLDSVRADALYARVLFLFLGLPGALLAVLVTLSVAGSGADRRRHEQALLRLRGASLPQVVALAAWESAAIGIAGVVLGWVLGAAVARASWPFADTRSALPWFAAAAVAGLILALAAFVRPAWRDAKQATVSSGRADLANGGEPLWRRIYLDAIMLALAAMAFWNVSRMGYHIVVATEGASQTSLHYEAFLAPMCLWIGAGLLAVRLARLGLGGSRALAAAIAPLSGRLAPLVAASLARQRQRIAAGAALVSLAFSFATATSIFNATYDAQSRVDAQLTNGADVTVTGTAASPASGLLDKLRAIPGVTVAEPLMHRYAYVGSDLQDLFGIDPRRIAKATTIADGYFANHDAARALEQLAQTPDGVLVAEETVKDFQLQAGDELNLRLQGTDHQYHAVPFHFIGVVREFPTAPKDSFLVANARYIASRTGSGSSEVVLLRTDEAPAVAHAARRLVAQLPGGKVSTLDEAQVNISSSLTAVDLRRLTALELGFSVLMIAGVAGLVLGLGMVERRRSFAIMSALGASRAQIGSFLWVEGLWVVVGGAVFGIAAGFGIAWTLVTILAGAFDPPPETLVVPWTYLGGGLATALICATLAIALMQRLSQGPDLAAQVARSR